MRESLFWGFGLDLTETELHSDLNIEGKEIVILVWRKQRHTCQLHLCFRICWVFSYFIDFEYSLDSDQASLEKKKISERV